MSWLAVRERADVHCFLSRLTWKVGRVWFNATVLKTVEQKCSVGSNPTLSSSISLYQRYHSHDTYVTALYHRMSYSWVSHLAGIHRVSWVIVQEIRMIFPPD